MEEWFSRFFQNLQLQLGLRDPKLTAPEKNISGIFLETDTGENIDILLVGKDGRVEELRGRTPAEELVRFTSLDFAEYHAVIQRLWTEHPLFLERMDVPYSDYEDFEKQISDLPDWIKRIDTISAFYASEHLRDAMAMDDNGSPIFRPRKVPQFFGHWTSRAGHSCVFEIFWRSGLPIMSAPRSGNGMERWRRHTPR